MHPTPSAPEGGSGPGLSVVRDHGQVRTAAIVDCPGRHHDRGCTARNGDTGTAYASTSETATGTGAVTNAADSQRRRRGSMLLLRYAGRILLLLRCIRQELISRREQFHTSLWSEICPAMTGRDGPEYLLMGFFDGLVGSRPRSRTHAKEGDQVVFDGGRFRGMVTTVAASEGWMQVRVDLGAGKLGTQVLGWPAPTSVCPREWELVHSSPRHAAIVSIGVRGEQNGGSSGEARRTGQHRSPERSNGLTDLDHRSPTRKRSRKQHIDSHEAEVVAMEHKCAKYRKKLSASESMGERKDATIDELARRREGNLTPRERMDYESKLQYWENKLRKWNARSENRASAKRRKRLRREREREPEPERERVHG